MKQLQKEIEKRDKIDSEVALYVQKLVSKIERCQSENHELAEILVRHGIDHDEYKQLEENSEIDETEHELN